LHERPGRIDGLRIRWEIGLLLLLRPSRSIRRRAQGGTARAARRANWLCGDERRRSSQYAPPALRRDAPGSGQTLVGGNLHQPLPDAPGRGTQRVKRRSLELRRVKLGRSCPTIANTATGVTWT